MSSGAKAGVECSSEKSVPDDIEKEIVGAVASDIHHVTQEKVTPTPQASGDRALVLMDLDNGLVGWESAEDSNNPQ